MNVHGQSSAFSRTVHALAQQTQHLQCSKHVQQQQHTLADMTSNRHCRQHLESKWPLPDCNMIPPEGWPLTTLLHQTALGP